jgi:excisionase family DNA binding protein
VALLDVNQTAEALGTSVRHVRELIYRKELPYYKVGALVRVDEDDLQAWLLAKRQPARTGPLRQGGPLGLAPFGGA